MVYLRPFARNSVGDPVRKCSASRLKRWFRQGIIGYAEDVDQPKAEPRPTPVETSFQEGGDQNNEVSDPRPVNAVEGGRGWWTVTFSDGSEKKMRKPDVEDLGLLASENGEDETAA